MSNPTEALAAGLLIGVCIGFIACVILVNVLGDKKKEPKS
jgi:hypothetical protein